METRQGLVRRLIRRATPRPQRMERGVEISPSSATMRTRGRVTRDGGEMEEAEVEQRAGRPLPEEFPSKRWRVQRG
jgi:hypothetical protein